MTETPDGGSDFAKGVEAAFALFGAIVALLTAIVLYLRKGLGSVRNGNGKKPEKDDSALLDYRLDRLEERMTKLEWLDEFERREKRRLDN